MVETLIGKYPIFYTRLEKVLNSDSDVSNALRVNTPDIFESTVKRLVNKGLQPVIVIDQFERGFGVQGCRLCELLMRIYKY